MFLLSKEELNSLLLSGTGGGVFDGGQSYQPTNPNSYLTTGNHFWTMTPCGGYNPFSSGYWYSLVFIVDTSGYLDDYTPINAYGLRPVINIRSDVTISGSGTKEDPYKLSVE